MNGYDSEKVKSMTQKELLIRIDERQHHIKKDVKDIKDNYVTQKEFQPIKKITYGSVGAILITILTIILSKLFG